MQGVVHTPSAYAIYLCSVYPCRAQKSEVPETSFLDVVATQNDHSTYLNHVLGSIYVFFTLFGYWVPEGGGSLKGLVDTLLMMFFTPGQLKKITVS